MLFAHMTPLASFRQGSREHLDTKLMDAPFTALPSATEHKCDLTNADVVGDVSSFDHTCSHQSRTESSDCSRDSIDMAGDGNEFDRLNDLCSDTSSFTGTPPIEIYGPKGDSTFHRRITPDCNTISAPAAVLRGREDEHSIVIDQRSWLEVEDEKHRYAKNLRAYHKEWCKQGHPMESFWTWLDKTNDDVPECSRAQLERDTVHYCTPDERDQYRVDIVDGRLFEGGEPVSTSEDGWIFVLRDDVIYARSKKTDAPRFHHSSFFGGECVAAAGMFVAENGNLTRVYPHSGHYRPTDDHLLYLLQFLDQQGVDMSAVLVDAQRVFKVARICTDDGRRVSKVDSPHLLTAGEVEHFLMHKKRARECGLLGQITLPKALKVTPRRPCKSVTHCSRQRTHHSRPSPASPT